MNRILKTALLRGVREAGTYDPNDVLHRVEEGLTFAECHSAERFLFWGQDNDRDLGHGYIEAVYGEFRDGEAASPLVERGATWVGRKS